MKNIKRYIHEFIKGNPFLFKCYIQSRTSGIEKLAKICEERKKESIFQYQNLAKPIPYTPYFLFGDSNNYGLGYLFVCFINNNIDRSIFVEHGYIYSSGVPSYFNESIYLNKIITFGEPREYFLKQAGFSHIIKVGPYIHYADSLLHEDELFSLKQNLGKVLLVFPSHSIDNKVSHFTLDKFIAYIDKLKLSGGFDTVMVCLYWKDIAIGRGAFYEKRGYKVVTAGHIYDLYFLHRLRSIISLADMTLSNDIGTHTGYCIYLNKPHQIFKQEVLHDFEDSQDEYDFQQSLVGKESMVGYYNIKEDISDLFKEYRTNISDEQYSYISELFGFDYVMDKDQLINRLS